MKSGAWREHRRDYKRNFDQLEKGSEQRMSASQFARVHRLDARVLRRRLREANYDRKGRHKVPVKDLETFCEERKV